MIQITPQMRILLAVEPVDFRKGIDGLAGICRRVLKPDPFSGYAFVFRNKRGTAIKILVYDGQGFWLCHKRLSTGRFRWWSGRGIRDKWNNWRSTSCKCCCGTAIHKEPRLCGKKLTAAEKNGLALLRSGKACVMFFSWTWQSNTEARHSMPTTSPL